MSLGPRGCNDLAVQHSIEGSCEALKGIPMSPAAAFGGAKLSFQKTLKYSNEGVH